MTEEKKRLLEYVSKANEEELIALTALMYAVTGGIPDDLERTKGGCKRAIKKLREAQNRAPEYRDQYEEAISLIRRAWMHREAST